MERSILGEPQGGAVLLREGGRRFEEGVHQEGKNKAFNCKKRPEGGNANPCIREERHHSGREDGVGWPTRKGKRRINKGRATLETHGPTGTPKAGKKGNLRLGTGKQRMTHVSAVETRCRP